MECNPASFKKTNVIDTCSVWNLLSSQWLYQAAKQTGCAFCITDVIYYECLVKPRSRPDNISTQLQANLKEELDCKQIAQYHLDIEDLQEVELLEGRKRYGRGELSAIALAKKFRISFLTDDRGAKKLASHNLGSENAQTVPHLLGWLVYEGYLTDGDVHRIKEEHFSHGGQLSQYFEVLYKRAMEYRLRTNYEALQ